MGELAIFTYTWAVGFIVVLDSIYSALDGRVKLVRVVIISVLWPFTMPIVYMFAGFKGLF